MTPERFTDWLQGFVEIANSDTISEKQWQIIKDHLKLVFDKVTPVRTPDRNESILKQITPTTPNTDWKRVSDLIGKEVKFNEQYKPPYEVTCKADPSTSLIC